MIKTLIDLFISALIVTLLVILVSTSSNLIWLSSMNMPINFNLALSTFFKDVIGMNFSSQIPLFILISLPLILCLFLAKVSLKNLYKNKIYFYSLTGAIAVLGLMLLLPLAFGNVEPISGSRTSIGKICMTICGFIGGYYFGFRQKKED
tara:strand:- start:58 stop:504 length:447 start_codon:yes stop_codon:yes gene_type:complete